MDFEPGRNENEGSLCDCRPGFGRRSNLQNATCERSQQYQIEVLTTSQSSETRIVRFNPRDIQKEVEKSLKKELNDIYQGSEVTSIKLRLEDQSVSKQSDGNDDMEIKIVVKVNEEESGNSGEDWVKDKIDSIFKGTQFPLGTGQVSRVSIEDFDECADSEANDCSIHATCNNTQGSYTCSCRDGYLDLSDKGDPGRVCTSSSAECDLCNLNGRCVLEKNKQVSCSCKPWYAGKNCQINLKLLLIVGAVSATLMMLIACGVSCFCCKDKRKTRIPLPYGVSMVRIPPSMRGHSLITDHGTVKSSYSARSRQQQTAPSSLHSNPSMRSSVAHPWNQEFGTVASRTKRSGPPSSSQMPRPAPQSMRSGQPNVAMPGPSRQQVKPTGLIIPRAKVTPTRSTGGASYIHHEEDGFSTATEKNRAVSEVASMASRHRRTSVPSFTGGFRRGREGSVDPLLEGFQSDGAESFHRSVSVSKGDLDLIEERTDTQSVARSYNETIIRPVTRALHTPAGTSYRSNRSNRTSEEGRTMADRDGGSSYVVSPGQQLYRLQDSDGSFESL